jgi:hypothetical protein
MEINQRVRVYATLGGVVAETKGTVTALRDDGMLIVRLDAPHGRAIVAHPKQCRKLKWPVEYRGVWAEKGSQIVFVPHCSFGDLKRRHLRSDGEPKNGKIRVIE